MKFLPDHLKTQEIWNDAVRMEPFSLLYIPDHFKTQETCDKAVTEDAFYFICVPDRFKAHEMCDNVVRDGTFSLVCVTDWFVTQQQVKLWRYDYDYYDYGRLIEWYNGYKHRKAQKAKIKEELMTIVWHPSRWQDWCVSEDENKRAEKMWK